MGKQYLKRKMNEEQQRKYAVSKYAVSKIAQLSRKVIQEAQRGDKISQKIILEACHNLHDLIARVKKGIRNENAEILLVGGLFENQYFKKRFMSSRFF